MENGYWVKFDVHRVSRSAQTPHGIRYSLTLHDRYNHRIIGFDNAHAIKTRSRKRYHARKIAWDHRHDLKKVKNYHFETPGQLLEDFWKAVYAVLKTK